MVGVTVHELGHNFGMAHSGGLNGETYTDHTGMMVRFFIYHIDMVSLYFSDISPSKAP